MTAPNESDRALRVIRALLVQAEGTTNTAEAEAFSLRAFELMDKYRIDLERVRPAGTTAPGYVQTLIPLYVYKYLRASLTLLTSVARHNGVTVLIGATGNSKTPTLVGTETDITATMLLFGSVIRQRDTACLASPVPSWTSTTTYRNSFCYGYAVRINARLEEVRARQKADAVATSDTAALVVYERDALVVAWIEKERGEALKNIGQNRPRLDPSAARDGDRAARLADLATEAKVGTDNRPRIEA